MALKSQLKNTNHQKIYHLLQTGKKEKALLLAKKLVKKTPNNPDDWYYLASVYAACNQITEVISCCEKAISINPQHYSAIYNLASALHQTGHTDRALSLYTQCIEFNPEHTYSLIGAGAIHLSKGDLDTASKYYSSAIKIDPNLTDAYYQLGIASQKKRDFPEAIKNYQATLKLEPRHLKALNNLGHINNELGNFSTAEQLFKQSILIHPESAQVHCNLGVVYESTGEMSKAEQCYMSAIAIDSEFLPALIYLGFLFSDEGRASQAITQFDHALTVSPTDETAIAGKAATLEKIGDLAGAKCIIDALIENGSKNPDVILTNCKIHLRLRSPEAALRSALSIAQDETLPAKGQSDIHRAIADLYESMDQHENAFKYYERANALSPYTYDHLKHVKHIEDIIKYSEASKNKTPPQLQICHRNLIFIVGMPRSGTSLVEQILSSHPEFFGAGELIQFGNIAKNCNYPQALQTLTSDEIDKLKQEYLSFIDKIAGDTAYVIDKMPHNFLYIGLILKIFPKAKFIHIKRNALDNCISLYFQGFNSEHSYSTKLDMLGLYYLEYIKLMQYWKDTFTNAIYSINYEDIVQDTEKETRHLLEFFGASWSEDCLKFYDNKRFVKTPSYDQVRRPIYNKSVDRWKKYSSYIKPLLKSLSTEPDTK